MLSSYEGMMTCGLRHGRGLLKWRDGSAYSGDFDGGARRGLGAMYYAQSGHRYVGGWEGDARSGEGIYYGTKQVRYCHCANKL